MTGHPFESQIKVGQDKPPSPQDLPSIPVWQEEIEGNKGVTEGPENGEPTNQQVLSEKFKYCLKICFFFLYLFKKHLLSTFCQAQF